MEKNMKDKEVLKKVEEYLKLDIEHGEREICSYAENLLDWIRKWKASHIPDNWNEEVR
tara:strand:+ start:564 stop:737 length:174 start_codon:yes stop_codon:yes gene_type:complete